MDEDVSTNPLVFALFSKEGGSEAPGILSRTEDNNEKNQAAHIIGVYGTHAPKSGVF
ncbi:MAG: hypothetical protein FWC90_04825 [Oscillospiraceae bacterium]|nr:hypothetical protein [Oscillospiraceae bacterium]